MRCCEGSEAPPFPPEEDTATFRGIPQNHWAWKSTLEITQSKATQSRSHKNVSLVGLGCLYRGRLHTHPGQSVQCSDTLNGKKFFLMLR